MQMTQMTTTATTISTTTINTRMYLRVLVLPDWILTQLRHVLTRVSIQKKIKTISIHFYAVLYRFGKTLRETQVKIGLISNFYSICSHSI